MSLELTGTVIEVFDTEVISEKFSKRTLVIETSDKYPQKVPFVFVQDKTSLLDELPKGTEVTVSFNVRGNEYKGKYYVELNGWKIELAGEDASGSTATPEKKESKSKVPAGDDDDDTLPF